MPSTQRQPQPMTQRELRTVAEAGGVAELTVTAEGADFFLQIATRSGQHAVLSKARSTQPRPFPSLNAAAAVLKSMGLAGARFDTTRWDPKAKHMNQNRPARAAAVRAAHRAAGAASAEGGDYNEWLHRELQASIDDTRPNIPFDDVMARMDKQLAGLKTRRKKGA